MWRNALLTFTSFSRCRRSRKTEATLAANAARATASIRPRATGSGWSSRCTASRAIRAVTTISVTALARAAITSALRNPYVCRAVAGRRPSRLAQSARTTAMTSLALCAASERRDTLPEAMPPRTSAAVIAVFSPALAQSRASIAPSPSGWSSPRFPASPTPRRRPDLPPGSSSFGAELPPSVSSGSAPRRMLWMPGAGTEPAEPPHGSAAGVDFKRRPSPSASDRGA